MGFLKCSIKLQASYNYIEENNKVYAWSQFMPRLLQRNHKFALDIYVEFDEIQNIFSCDSTTFSKFMLIREELSMNQIISIKQCMTVVGRRKLIHVNWKAKKQIELILFIRGRYYY